MSQEEIGWHVSSLNFFSDAVFFCILVGVQELVHELLLGLIRTAVSMKDTCFILSRSSIFDNCTHYVLFLSEAKISPVNTITINFRSSFEFYNYKTSVEIEILLPGIFGCSIEVLIQD